MLRPLFGGLVAPAVSYSPREHCAARTVCAAEPSKPRPQRNKDRPQRNKDRPPPRKLPESGYFGAADTKAEVYSPLARVSNNAGDITQKGGAGRYGPEFIWNSNWQDQLKYEETLKRIREKAAEREADLATAREEAGRVSFNRRALLDSMDVDLSAQLRPRKTPANGDATASTSQQQRQGRMAQRASYIKPTKGEARKWDRGGKFSRRVVATPATNDVDADELAQRVAAERARYDQLKEELLLWTLSTAGVLFAATWGFYGQDTAVSYGVGAAGGTIYLRLLNRSVEGIGGSGFAAVGSALGQQRLLVPLILVLAFNRWNTLAADTYGVHLLLLPMLAGFFTYKGAVVARASVSLWEELTSSLKSEGSDGSAGDGAGEEGGEEGGLGEEERRRIDKRYSDTILSR